MTSSPLALRASCTSRTTSRASPARRSSGVTVRSSATVSPPSAATAQPVRGVSVTITSPAASATVLAVHRDRGRPAVRTAAASAAGSAAAIAAATALVPLPNRLPSERKFGFTLTSTRSPPAAAEGLDRLHVQLVGDLGPQLLRQRGPARGADQGAAQRLPGPDLRRGPGRAAELDQPAYQRDLRRPAPGRTARRRRPRSASRAGAPSPAASGGPEATRGSTVSVTNGVNGASSRVSTSRHSYSVASAAGSPSQNRRRDRRTYQLDRSSTNSASRRPARAVSKSSSAASTSATVRCSSASAQRSSSGRSATASATGGARRPARRVGVQDEERGGVPVRQQDLADDLLQRRVPDPAGRPGRAAQQP